MVLSQRRQGHAHITSFDGQLFVPRMMGALLKEVLMALSNRHACMQAMHVKLHWLCVRCRPCRLNHGCMNSSLLVLRQEDAPCAPMAV